MTDLTQEIVRELLDYDPETGVLKWRERERRWFGTDRAWNAWNARFAGKQAGFPSRTQRYAPVQLFNRGYLAHRLIWLWMTGTWPVSVDHINHVRTDNRWLNLRVVTLSENNKNRSLPTCNTSGAIGVYWDAARGKWRARVKVDGRDIHLGLFSDKADAIAARQSAGEKFGFHANHGVQP